MTNEQNEYRRESRDILGGLGIFYLGISIFGATIIYREIKNRNTTPQVIEQELAGDSNLERSIMKLWYPARKVAYGLAERT